MKTKKCFSKCRKIPEDACKEKKRFCQFTKGTRKYCRISKFYALDEKCDMYLKLQKKKKLNLLYSIKFLEFLPRLTLLHYTRPL